MATRRDHAIGVLCLFLTAGCWGFVASTVKWLTAFVDPYAISFSRVCLGAIVFGILFVVHKGDWRRILWLSPWVLVGALGRAGNYLLYNVGLVHAPSNAAVILAPVQTISVALLASWLLGESIRPKWAGLALSLAGLTLVWWNGERWDALTDIRYYGGNALLLMSGVASAFQFCSQRALSSRSSSLEILLPVFSLSTLITLPFAWTAGSLRVTYAPATWGWILFLGLGLTGGSFLLLAEGYRRAPATTAVVITNTSVFLTLLWSSTLLGERVTVLMIVGALLGVAGTVAVIWSDGRQIRSAQALRQGLGEAER